MVITFSCKLEFTVSATIQMCNQAFFGGCCINSCGADVLVGNLLGYGSQSWEWAEMYIIALWEMGHRRGPIWSQGPCVQHNHFPIMIRVWGEMNKKISFDGKKTMCYEDYRDIKTIAKIPELTKRRV